MQRREERKGGIKSVRLEQFGISKKTMTRSDQLWGGRFTEKSDETFAAFNRSFDFDKRLFAADARAQALLMQTD